MTEPADPLDHGELDVAIVGAGAAGTYLGYWLIRARPDWRIAIFERLNRIGGRLWTVKVDGLAHQSVALTEEFAPVDQLLGR